MSSKWKRCLPIDFPCGSLTADNSSLKRRAINGRSNDTELDSAAASYSNLFLEDELHSVIDPAHAALDWQEVTDALLGSENPKALPGLQTSSNHNVEQCESYKYNCLETSKLCNINLQDSRPNGGTCFPCENEVLLQDFNLDVQSLIEADSNQSSWARKRVSSAETESMVSYKGQSEHSQHPAPWLISTHWIPTLLMACAKSISKKDAESTNHLMWVLNSLASPKDATLDCRMASYFVHALQCKVNGTGRALQRRISQFLQNLNIDLKHTLKKKLMWREVTPWSAFGQEAANAAIFEALKGEDKVHVVDVSYWASLCTQWPTLLEALATRAEGAPHFRLTVVVMRSDVTFREVMNAISRRMTRFACLMGLPSFTFSVVYEPALEKLDAHTLDVRTGEALVVNLNQTLQYLPTRVRKCGGGSPRDMTLEMLCKCNPKIMVVIENEVDQVSNTFADKFCSFYEFVSVFVGSMNRPDMATNQARLNIQEKMVKILILNDLACDEEDGEGGDDGEEFRKEGLAVFAKREPTVGWIQRLNHAGFEGRCLGTDVLHGVVLLLKMYPLQWGLLYDAHQKDHAVGRHEHPPSSLTLTWRGYPIHTFTVWSPSH